MLFRSFWSYTFTACRKMQFIVRYVVRLQVSGLFFSARGKIKSLRECDMSMKHYERPRYSVFFACSAPSCIVSIDSVNNIREPQKIDFYYDWLHRRHTSFSHGNHPQSSVNATIPVISVFGPRLTAVRSISLQNDF